MHASALLSLGVRESSRTTVQTFDPRFDGPKIAPAVVAVSSKDHEQIVDQGQELARRQAKHKQATACVLGADTISKALV